MAITTISIKDVFKQKAKDSVHGSTIWVDINGTQYTDNQCPNLETSVNCKEGYYISDCILGNDGDTLVIDGLVIQVGSHVKKFIGGLMSRPNIPVPSDFDPSNIFKYATNLAHLYGTFGGPIIDLLDCRNNFPEDIFWACSTLEICSNVFANSTITKIPEKLFAKNHNLTDIKSCFENSGITDIPKDLFKQCTELTSVNRCFSDCKNLTQIDSDLFSSNTKLKTLRHCFSGTGLTGIPVNLFDGLTENGLELDFVFANCPNLTDVPVPFAKKLPDDTSMYGAFADTAFAAGCVDGGGKYNTISMFDYFPKDIHNNIIATALGISYKE